MDETYRSFFGFEKEPFSQDLQLDEILQTDELREIKHRFDYTLRIGGIGLVTGEIGSGKSTALRYAAGGLHPAEYHAFYVTASTGSIMELYRQIVAEMGISRSSNSKAHMTHLIRKEIVELIENEKMKVTLIVDEASLMRLDVFVELHTICQFEKDSKPYLPLILAGQANLVDKLMYRTSALLASRIIARAHMEGLTLDGMQKYLLHHLTLAGINKNLFDQPAVTAIHQGSGGLLRKANHLARGALMAAADEKSMMINAEHVRLAATELF